MGDMGGNEGAGATPMTWAALLGQWMRFAQSALALPDDAEGRAWKRIVSDIIGLQAVSMALAEADQLPADERALAVDRSRVLIERYRGHIEQAFGGGVGHPMLAELIADAEAAADRLARDSAGPGDPGGGNP